MTSSFLSEEKRQIARNLLKQRGLAGTQQHAIPRCNDAGSAPLSFAQQRLWYHEQLHPNSGLFNTPIVVELKGDLNTIALARALDQIIERHEVLRTVFRVVDGEPCQLIQTAYSIPLPVEDLSYLPLEKERYQIAMKSAEDSVRASIDLSNGPVFHARLIKLDEQCWWLLVICHHIVFDGVSMSIFLKELAAWYTANTGQGSPLPPLPVQYGDFARWQRSKDMEVRLDEQLIWWMQKLKNAPAFLALPTDRPRPPVQSFRGNSCTFTISAEVRTDVEAFARASGVTTFVVLASALKLLLYRLTGQSDLIISTGVATRQYKEVEDLVGCFINVLLLRTELSGALTCDELVQRVSETSMSAFAHQDLPFERLVTALSPERDLSYNPLAQVMIVHHNAGIEEPELTGIRMRRVMPEKLIAQYDLLLHLIPSDGELQSRLEYSADLFDGSTAERMCEQYVHLLREILERPQADINAVPLLPQRQVDAILALNKGPAAFPHDRCIHSLIEDRVVKHPNAPAIETVDSVVSYAELNRDANKLAHRCESLVYAAAT